MKRAWSGAESLKKIPLFSACTRQELDLIYRAATELRVPAGQMLARQGSNGHEFIVISEGSARVEINDKVIATLGPGGFFGEIALLDGGPRTASVIAETDVVVEVIGQPEFAGVIEGSPHLAQRLLVGLARRLRAADLQLAE